MESTHLYRYNSDDKITDNQSEINQDIFGLTDLDPSFEHSFDLHTLIDDANIDISQDVDIELSSLPETFNFKAGNSECETKVNYSFTESECSITDSSNETNVHELLNLVTGTSFEYMTQGDEITTASGLEAATVKTEDLELASSQSASYLTTPPLTQNSTSGRKPPVASNTGKSRKRQFEKNTDEYFEKRAKNNIAVRKSRDKTKLRNRETEGRVFELTEENEQLQKKVGLLTKELDVIKSLFINIGASLPDAFKQIMDDSEQ